MKENAMGFMDTAVQDVLTEPTHVKDAIGKLFQYFNIFNVKDKIFVFSTARNVVEMAKREYPQQWPTFLGELQQLAVKGEAQAELVM